MPTISVNRDQLFERLGQRYTDEDFDELCFQFGIELDDVTTETAMRLKELGATDNTTSSNGGDESVIYRIDVPANRYDLLCLEGLSQALRVFLGSQNAPEYTLAVPHQPLRMTVAPEVGSVRPFVVAAVLRNVTFDAASYRSFIDLQEKLHLTICRKRSLVAIGTHDLDTIEAPFSYEALAPNDIWFMPLNQSKEMTGNEVMAHYAADQHIKKYLHLIRDAPRYPVIVDAKRRVLSLPPIINGNHSKISVATKNVLIECTATDMTKAKVVLNTLVTTFSQYCAVPYTVEPVEVINVADGTSSVYPDFASHEITAAIDYINAAIGAPIAAHDAIKLLQRMGLKATVSADARDIIVQVPPTRSDIMHACDVMEDIAVAFGFNKIAHAFVETNNIAAPLPVNKLTDMLRFEAALAGFTEMLTFALCSADEISTHLNKPKAVDDAVSIANPKTLEFQVVRTSLLPGLLKCIACNRQLALPLQVFEISDVVFKDPSRDVGASNRRRLCAVFCGNVSGFELVHGLLDRLMLMLKVKRDAVTGYSIKPANDPTYFPDRHAQVLYQNQVIGVVGVIHPEVSKRFDLNMPCSCLELDIEPFV